MIKLALLCLLATLFSCHKPPRPPEPTRIDGKPLQTHVEKLAGEIGERNPDFPKNLEKAAAYIESSVKGLGFTLSRQVYESGRGPVRNIILRKQGRRPGQGLLIIGAHYDSAPGTPGADDNASGTAALIETARTLGPLEFEHDLELVFFTLEEPPYFRTPRMGSAVYLKSLEKRGAKIHLMICLEMLGYYSRDKIQNYPLAIMKLKYPSRGDFIAVIGKRQFKTITNRFFKLLESELSFGTEKLIAPINIHGIDFSDHLNFWDAGKPALMLTDTAFFRNKNYHETTDLPPSLDYDKLAILTAALGRTITRLDKN